MNGENKIFLTASIDLGSIGIFETTLRSVDLIAKIEQRGIEPRCSFVILLVGGMKVLL
jgi:hypothetical protein